MSSDILNAMTISASGMRVQGTRIRVIAENLANADTAALVPGGDPYQRQIITFKNVLDKKLDVKKVTVDKIEKDTQSEFIMKYMPDHPGADAKGYVKMPNVNTLIELMDSKEAQRSYEANLGMIEQSRNIVNRTIDLLRN